MGENNHPIPEAILRFVGRHHVMTLATVGEGVPWCANCFYAFDKRRGVWLFTSDPATRHGREMVQNSRVAASIVLETRVVGRVQGLQISGCVRPADAEGRACYLKRFPYAAVADLHLWELEPSVLKLTDNTLGFGKKIVWERFEQE